MTKQPTKAQQRAMHRKHVFLLTDGPGKPLFWGNHFSNYWYATKEIPYTEWKGDTHDFQEYLWDVRDLHNYDKATDAQFDLPHDLLFGKRDAALAAIADLTPKQRAYHYSVLCAAEIPPLNGVRQFWLAGQEKVLA